LRKKAGNGSGLFLLFAETKKIGRLKLSEWQRLPENNAKTVRKT